MSASVDPELSPKEGVLSELKIQLRLAWPIGVTQLTQITFCMEALLFSGHLGKVELDGVALATSLVNVLGISVAVGLVSACETLFAQIYGSANKKLVGVVLIRGLVIISLICLPCIGLYCNMENLLISTGQNPTTASTASEYLLLFIPGLLAFAVFIVTSRYLQNQNIVYPTMIVGIVANGANILLQYCFVQVLDLGPRGSALALSLSLILLCILNLAYLLLSRTYTETWGDWGQFCKLAFSGLIMVSAEWWVFEFGVITSGIMGGTELGASSIILQLSSLYYQVPRGIAVASSIRVGQQLGAGNAEGAKTAVRVSLFLGVCIGIFVAIIYCALRSHIPRMFTNECDVVELTATVLPHLAAVTVFDGITCVASGILRGLGRQALGAGMALVGYPFALAIGIPCLFYTPLSVAGLWMGLAVAEFMQATFVSVVLYRQDWSKAVKEAKMRAKEEPEMKGASEMTALFVPDKDSHRTGSSGGNIGFYMQRASVALLCVTLLAFGVGCRFWFPPPSSRAVTDTVATLAQNTTLSFLTLL